MEVQCGVRDEQSAIGNQLSAFSHEQVRDQVDLSKIPAIGKFN